MNIKILIKNFFRKILWFEIIGQKIDFRENNTKFLIIKNKDDFLKLFNFKNYDKYLMHKIKRFSNKDVICYILIEENSVASIAWSIWDNQFFFDEINKLYQFEGKKLILYDMETLKEFRGKGYYKLVYKNIINANIGLSIGCFSLPSNFISIKGIKSAGFVKKHIIYNDYSIHNFLKKIIKK